MSRFKNYMEKSGSALGGGGSSRKGKNRCKQCHLLGHRKAACPQNPPKPRYELITSHFDFSVGNLGAVLVHSHILPSQTLAATL